MDDFTVIKTLLSLLFSGKISNNFIIKKVQNFSEHIEIYLEELANLVPEALSESKKIISHNTLK